MNLYRAKMKILVTGLHAGGSEIAWSRTFVTVISPLFLISNTSAMFPGIDISRTGQERRRVEGSMHL